MSLAGIHSNTKTRICPECKNVMYRVQIRYRPEAKTEHYQCLNEICLAKIRIVTKTKSAMKIHTMIIEMEKREQ